MLGSVASNDQVASCEGRFPAMCTPETLSGWSSWARSATVTVQRQLWALDVHNRRNLMFRDAWFAMIVQAIVALYVSRLPSAV